MIKYKILSNSACNWAIRESTGKEIWEVMTDGVQRSPQLLEEIFTNAPKDELTVEVISHFDEFIDVDRVGVEDLRKAHAYLLILRKCVGSSGRVEMCVHEVFYTKLTKLTHYHNLLTQMMDEGTLYSKTIHSILYIIRDITSILRKSDIDVWFQLHKPHLEDNTNYLEMRQVSTDKFLFNKLYHYYCQGLGWTPEELDFAIRSKGVKVPKMYGWDTYNAERQLVNGKWSPYPVEHYLDNGTKLIFNKQPMFNINQRNRMLLFQRQ